ncbi:MFS transporter [Nocardia yunnanensis]|uniref:MFS transporter n=1 Tax=Nocardia yunnanensis TaxID=2382165 RepID=UPI001CA3F98B|nr:MFS transporter [Nocardia yunnanensis]
MRPHSRRPSPVVTVDLDRQHHPRHRARDARRPGARAGANPAQLQWASGSYTLVFAALMFTAGALEDRFGHRGVLAAGLLIFAAASIWAAYAGDPGQLIAARAVMRVGSALIMPATMAMVTWTFTGPAAHGQRAPRHAS